MAMRKYEFDPVYHIIRLFDKVGIVRIKSGKNPDMIIEAEMAKLTTAAVAD